ncbi:EamA family transporter RarD [Cryobacterium sp. BB736]|uniref:EamA family transporter RarD n=1 Tax=Cryobacterium sp. BB736 TaxID=2746963 RepID=UPI001875739E|nr:EamA family transporter RarD [Cryobacterium sp. BB736]
MQQTATSGRAGALYAVGAYGLWGVLPIYFVLLLPTGPIEVVGWRIIFSLVFCAVLLTVTRAWRALIAIVRQPRLFFTLGLAGLLIVINWQVYVYATLNGQVIETSLGYFINPIVTVLLGVLLLRERLRAAQWVAVGISGIAVLVIAIGYGVFPWVSLALAFSFGLYGFVKKRVGPRVDAVSGLTLETAWLIPVAIGQLWFVSATSGLVFGNAGAANVVLLLASGVITAVPLLLFAAAARRLPLVYMGLFQYLAPVLQFIVGAFILHEAMPLERWIGFALVWVALIVLTTDMLASGRARRASPLPG